MRYADGTDVRLGDVVTMSGSAGRVVCVIGDRRFTDEFSEANWGHLQRGALIEFEQFGLIYYEHEPETDISFVDRQP